MESWTLIAEGQITSLENLTQSITTANEFEANFFRIPVETFTETPTKGNGGIRSFYITTNTSSFIYLNPPEGKKLYDESPTTLSAGAGSEVNAPKILIGEGVVSYPMPEEALSYLVKSFVGRVYYEEECPSSAPSESTSESPSSGGTPYSSPSLTLAPTVSVGASEMTSSMPSSSPTVKMELVAVEDGLSVVFSIECDASKKSDEQSNDAVANAVLQFVQQNMMENSCIVNTRIANAVCVQHVTRSLGVNKRHLSTSFSDLDFSVVISSECSRPATRPGKSFCVSIG